MLSGQAVPYAIAVGTEVLFVDEFFSSGHPVLTIDRGNITALEGAPQDLRVGATLKVVPPVPTADELRDSEASFLLVIVTDATRAFKSRDWLESWGKLVIAEDLSAHLDEWLEWRDEFDKSQSDSIGANELRESGAVEVDVTEHWLDTLL